ncbi:MAG: hypothetical protein JWQ24_350 [Tardiphaga sp.]|nr:hypothetical protein [Tardiphaga sp.]
MEMIIFIAAPTVFAVLIYGVKDYHCRDKRKSKITDQIVRDRYHNLC